MQKIVRNVSLAVVAFGVMFAMTAPARADSCCAAACCVTVHHCHHGWHHRHACCRVAVAPSCGCTTCAPVVTAAPPIVAPVARHAAPCPPCVAAAEFTVCRFAGSDSGTSDHRRSCAGQLASVERNGQQSPHMGSPRFRGLPCGRPRCTTGYAAGIIVVSRHLTEKKP